MVIETQVWEPNPDKPGYLQLVRTRTIGEVFRDIRAAFGDYPEGAEEYLTITTGLSEDSVWPAGRIAVFPVTGGSEGHYVHVEVFDPSGVHFLVILGKTFAGWDAAWYFAKHLAERLGV